MSAIKKVISREYFSFFKIPAGWFALSVMMLSNGLLFIFDIFEPGKEASLRPLLQLNGWLLLFIGPALGMRTFSEEYRSGTWCFLANSKLTNSQIVFGKFVSILLLLVTSVSPLLPCGIVLEIYGDPDWGEFFCGLLGVLLAGVIYGTTAMFFSSWTSSQSVAFLGGIFFWMMLTLLARFTIPILPESIVSTVVYLDITQKIVPFSLGLFDTANLIYLFSWILVILFFTVCIISQKRWTA